ncbi:SDR family NAD(P)-dependent oxidoreductase [Niveispirillum sp. KHB5.9]|uniref:SDR family NAD(P)-dependent oxidoreductase n=1 Tax=Niveispirillum sp. KHB5.9 TaxID=3400269 RepID=UPI003A83AF55
MIAHNQTPILAGRRAAITGGTTGIGRAIALRLAGEGATVFICGRTQAHLDDALQAVRQVGTGDGMTIDLAGASNPAKFFAKAAEYLGGMDIAIINAAVPVGGLTEVTADELHYAIAINFTACVTSCHAAWKHMGKAGHIVLIGSTSAHSLAPGSTIYAGMKAGIAGFSEALTKELGPKGIRVSLVEPGRTSADLHEGELTDAEQREQVRQGRMLQADDIAAGVRYLLTQPDHTIVQQLTIVPRRQED